MRKSKWMSDSTESNGIILNVISVRFGVCVLCIHFAVHSVFHRLHFTLWFNASLSCVCGLMNKSFALRSILYASENKQTANGLNVKMDASPKDEHTFFCCCCCCWRISQQSNTFNGVSISCTFLVVSIDAGKNHKFYGKRFIDELINWLLYHWKCVQILSLRKFTLNLTIYFQRFSYFQSQFTTKLSSILLISFAKIAICSHCERQNEFHKYFNWNRHQLSVVNHHRRSPSESIVCVRCIRLSRFGSEDASINGEVGFEMQLHLYVFAH